MAALLTRAMRRGALAHVRGLRPVPVKSADGLVAAVYAQVERDFGMLAPPIALHAPAPETLAAAWLMLRETLIASGTAGRIAKEAVATGVSLANACPYCVDVHGAMLEGGPGDRPHGTLTSWARELAADLRHETPFPAAQLPEFGGVAVTFHYLNRMVNVFLQETLIPRGAPGIVRRMIERVMRGLAGGTRRPGDSLHLLPPATLPADLAWAAGVPTVAQALSRAAAAIGEAGERAVPAAVRELVLVELAGWDGRPRGPSRAWVADAVSRLPAADRAAGRLALLTAIASFQVDRSAIEDCGFGDRRLVALTSWASFAAARRIGAGLPVAQAVPGAHAGVKGNR